MTSSTPNPYDASQTPSENRVDWKTWSPFQSQTVREICANMTADERSETVKRGSFYGLWVVVSVAFPLQFLFMGFLSGHLNPGFASIAITLVFMHVLGIPVWQNRQRQFLAGTEWARQNGIDANNLKLFNFHEQR